MLVLLRLQPFIFIIFISAGVIFGLYQGTNIFDKSEKSNYLWWTTLLKSLSLISFIHVIPVIIGFLIPHKKTINCIDKLRNINNNQLPNLFIRYVTRGNNQNTITSSVINTLELLDRFENTYIEVITDNPILEDNLLINNLNKLFQIVVPPNYSTSNNSVYKARALQYGLENSIAQTTDYILHLDEESHLTTSSIYGIYQHIYENPNKIGQGIITYKRSLYTGIWNLKHTFLTLADSIRIADDLSRFRLSFIMGNPIFGCKGSFILIKNEIELKIGFNMPPELCITEDASFAFNSYQQKFKFAFVEGFIEEISPSNFIDFIKQRARWLRGLWLIIKHHPSHISKRIIMTFGIITWSLIGLNIISFISFFIFTDYNLHIIISIMVGICFSTYIFSYLFGAIIGGYGIISILTVPLSPLFLILESISVIYALFTINNMKFHIIQKT